jgi:hypothetical protein
MPTAKKNETNKKLSGSIFPRKMRWHIFQYLTHFFAAWNFLAGTSSKDIGDHQSLPQQRLTFDQLKLRGRTITPACQRREKLWGSPQFWIV